MPCCETFPKYVDSEPTPSAGNLTVYRWYAGPGQWWWMHHNIPIIAVAYCPWCGALLTAP